MRGYIRDTESWQAPILALDGLSWSCGQPSHNGDVTRVILMSFSPEGGSIIESRLDLPGQGSVGLANNGDCKSECQDEAQI